MLTTTLLPLLLASLPTLTSATTSSKRGLVYVPSKNANEAKDDQIWISGSSDLTWYYNYGASPSAVFNGHLNFVPMLWGAPASNTDMTFYNTVKGLIDSGVNISYVLAFNEPDGASNGGSNVPADTAAATWIRELEPLRKLGVKLGAPAVTGAPTGFNWLQNFFTACAGNCTADFIPVHWYGNFEGLASHIGQVRGTYPNMTVWVTEYADASVSLQASQSFANQSSAYFDRIDYITHYSYFGSFRSSASNVGPNAAMLNQDGKLTDIGSWYLGGAATGVVPKGSGASAAGRPLAWGALLAGVVALVGLL
ncbi:hypothetical protein B0A49_02699 [Cryomyces minteri]|uniref:Asl1-like glycosyl hydrolase catalytic domain-containing protein n=1 Tax=Cryomyces minteri TaxID=331657 RepID=A0A4U0XSJ0_9PEZI|nr:hypothetical protein B0A49_02699 [Cryomyces minteri]